MKAEFYYDRRRYTCSISQINSFKELRIRNYQGIVLAIKQGEKNGLLGKKRQEATEVDVSQPHFYNLIKAALNALKLQEITQTLLDKEQLISNLEQIIEQKDQQLKILKQKNSLLSEQFNQLTSEQRQRFQVLEFENQELDKKIDEEKKSNRKLKDELAQSMAYFDSKRTNTEIINRVGNSTWNCLAKSSRKELCDSYRQYQLISYESFTAWLSKGESAASVIAQIRQIRNRVSHPEPVYQWQFRILQVIMMGGGIEKGALQKIYED